MSTRQTFKWISLSLLLLSSAQAAPETPAPKYVFFFLGDGMSTPQIQAAEAFYAGDEDSAVNLRNPQKKLNMTKMPVSGLATTYCANRFITDSAAAATAFACGVKTAPGVIGRSPDRQTSYKSIAELAKERNRAIGIVTSVSLPHASPAGFYAKVNSRESYVEIGYQAALSGFDFFGGGCFRYLDATNNVAGIPVKKALADAGYTTYTQKSDVLALKNARKVICSVATSYGSDAMPYAIDRPEENFSLAEITQTAIHCLQDNADGFFIFVEGGKIDWAGHANDAVANIRDTLAFDQSIGVAVEFLKKHPKETLIVVTGDHETGGMTLGFSGTGYQTAFATLRKQRVSFERFNYLLSGYASAHPWTSESNVDDDMKRLIQKSFGLDWNQLAAPQKEELELAYDRAFHSSLADSRASGYDLDGAKNVDYLLYGGHNALTVTITHIMNREAGLTWSSYSHTALPVPVMAMGCGAEAFGGFYDNTDIAKKLAAAMRIGPLPVEDPDHAGALDF